jgi:hypothetical protein
MLCARNATAAVVAKVPMIPSEMIGAAAALNLRHPMCIPPSNKMTASATVTTCSTALIGTTLSASGT